MANNSKSAAKVKLNPLKVFSGKQTELNKFLQDVLVYLTVNKEVYNNDKKKIMYLLSFMTEGDAASWKEEFLAWKIKEAKKNDTDLKLGTFKEVKEMIKKSFKPFDGPGDALEEMKRLRMANNSNNNEHVTKFKMLVTQSSLSDSTAVMDFFWETLPTPLQKQVMTCENPPTTLKDWYKKATKFHSNWQKMQRIFGWKSKPAQSTSQMKRKFQFLAKKERDPNTMDVDSMTTNEQAELMRKGACFKCKKTGHQKDQCPDNEPQQKKTRKDVYGRIRAMIAELPKEEQKAMMDEMEKNPLEMDFA